MMKTGDMSKKTFSEVFSDDEEPSRDGSKRHNDFDEQNPKRRSRKDKDVARQKKKLKKLKKQQKETNSHMFASLCAQRKDLNKMIEKHTEQNKQNELVLSKIEMFEKWKKDFEEKMQKKCAKSKNEKLYIVHLEKDNDYLRNQLKNMNPSAADSLSEPIQITVDRKKIDQNVFDKMNRWLYEKPPKIGTLKSVCEAMSVSQEDVCAFMRCKKYQMSYCLENGLYRIK